MIEIHTYIKNGLPVIARGSFVAAEPDVGLMEDGIEDLEILYCSGHNCNIDLSDVDERRIVSELLTAKDEEWS